MPFSTEILLKSISNNLRVKEVQVSYDTRVGRSKLDPIRDGARIIIYMLSQNLR
jgi:hypothetical protein